MKQTTNKNFRGHMTYIPTHIIIELVIRSFKLREIIILLVIARYQYNFNQQGMKKCILKNKDFTCYGLSKSDISKGIADLEQKGVIITWETMGNGEQYRCMRINENVDMWKIDIKKKVSRREIMLNDTLHAIYLKEIVQSGKEVLLSDPPDVVDIRQQAQKTENTTCFLPYSDKKKNLYQKISPYQSPATIKLSDIPADIISATVRDMRSIPCFADTEKVKEEEIINHPTFLSVAITKMQVSREATKK